VGKMVTYCGIDCLRCPIYLATREDDDEKRQEMRLEIARKIAELYGQECTLEDITDCDGCKAESGKLFSGCKRCQIRKCARQKEIENCAYCEDYTCEALQKLFATDPDAKKCLGQIRGGL
jgi:hypothetical protein